LNFRSRGWRIPYYCPRANALWAVFFCKRQNAKGAKTQNFFAILLLLRFCVAFDIFCPSAILDKSNIETTDRGGNSLKLVKSSPTQVKSFLVCGFAHSFFDRDANLLMHANVANRLFVSFALIRN